jgi:3-hydroxyisobutyrate dehydrogenase
MVPEGSHVRSVYLTPSSDVLSSNLILKPLIDCSTIDTAASPLHPFSILEYNLTAAFYDDPPPAAI